MLQWLNSSLILPDGGWVTLIEVTGRFGQLPLSIAPGVGFPCLPCTMVTEGDVDPAFGDCARVGCRPVRAILRDLLCHAASLRNGGGGSGVIRGFLRSGGMGCDILSKRDLLPAVGVMGGMVRRTGAVGGGGVGAMCEIDDRNLSSIYGGGYS